MSTKAVFSNDYYTNPLMLWSIGKAEKTPEGSLKVEVSGFFNFWNHRNTHVCVDDQGTFSTVPFSLFEDLKRYFGFSQNQDLIAVHQKLKTLQAQIQNSSSPELQILKNEIHEKKATGASNLTWNLALLAGRFEQGNKASEQAATFLKVINFICKLLHWQPIEHYHYDRIDTAIFEDKAVRPALELTPQERESTKFFPVIQLNAPLTLPINLTRENMHKLELGLMDKISFNLEGKNFILSFDKPNERFILAYTTSDDFPTFSALLNSRQNTSFYSDPLNVVEKKFGGSNRICPLQYHLEYTCSGSWFIPKQTFKSLAGSMELSANCEYTIPLSQGNLNITMYPRIRLT